MVLHSKARKILAWVAAQGCRGLPLARRMPVALLIGVFLGIQPAPAALRLQVRFGELERSVAVADLAQFAATGEAPAGLIWYLNRLSGQDRAALRKTLSQSLPITPVMLSNLFTTPIGQELVAQLAKLLTLPATTAQQAIQSALLLGAAKTGQLRLIDALEAFPLQNLTVNGTALVSISHQLGNQLNGQNNLYPGLLAQFSTTGPKPVAPGPDFLDAATPGRVTYTSKPFEFVDRTGNRIQALITLPTISGSQAKPALVILAPGLNTDYSALLYVGNHLSSHGYAVATLNFPYTSADAIQAAINGTAPIPSPRAWFKQPATVSDLIDVVQRRWGNRLDSTRVGALGQSLGGYTVTALAGAPLDWTHLRTGCRRYANPHQVEINLAKLWQCQDTSQPIRQLNQQDGRIKAVIAVNPVINPIFSATSLGSIATPYLMVAGTDDIFAPPLSEQMLPYTSLKPADRILALVNGGTHLSFLAGTSKLPSFLVGPNQREAFTELKALSLLFFNRYLNATEPPANLMPPQAPLLVGTDPLQMMVFRQLSQQNLRLATPIACDQTVQDC
jgi:predicted dienelactone hydrolase